LGGMGTRRARGAPRSEQGVTLKEVQSGEVITPQDMERVRELLTRWTLRHGQVVLEEAGLGLDNRVTPDGIKGYGGANGAN
jgi:hypothetical protein